MKAFSLNAASLLMALLLAPIGSIPAQAQSTRLRLDVQAQAVSGQPVNGEGFRQRLIDHLRFNYQADENLPVVIAMVLYDYNGNVVRQIESAVFSVSSGATHLPLEDHLPDVGWLLGGTASGGNSANWVWERTDHHIRKVEFCVCGDRSPEDYLEGRARLARTKSFEWDRFFEPGLVEWRALTITVLPAKEAAPAGWEEEIEFGTVIIGVNPAVAASKRRG